MNSPDAGTPGDAAAAITGFLSLNSQLPSDGNGGVLVEANSTSEAAGRGIVGTITVQFAGETLSYAFGPNTVGGTAAEHKPFLVGANSISLEDLAGSAFGSDYD